VTTTVSEIVEKTGQLVTDSTSKFTQVFNERIVPEVSAIYGRLTKACVTILQAVVDVAAHYVAVLSGVLEKFSEELKPLMESCHSVINGLLTHYKQSDINNT
jgi:hypothetical protein